MKGEISLRNLRIAGWIAVLTFIEAMLGTYIKIGDIMPDLLFVFVLCYAVLKNSINSTITISAICGALADCLCGRIFGTYFAIFLLSGVLIWFIRQSIFKNSILISIILIFAFCVLGKSMYFVANISVLKDAGYLYSLFRIILPEAVYNTFVSALMFPIVRLTLRKRSGLYR